MKKIVLVLFMLLSLSYSKTVDDYYKELYTLNETEQYNLLFSYAMGYKDDLGLALAAIAWKESYFGKYPMNLADGEYGSFGMYHVVLDYAAIRNGSKSNWAKSRLAEALVKDKVFAAEEAIGVLKHFLKRKGCNWKCAIASYNVGNAGLKSKKGVAYSEDISKRVKAIDMYFTKHQIHDKIKESLFSE